MPQRSITTDGSAPQTLVLDASTTFRAAEAHLRQQTYAPGRVDPAIVLLPGARSWEDCLAAGFPAWLLDVLNSLYQSTVYESAEQWILDMDHTDQRVIAEEQVAADAWFRAIARAMAVPVDYDQAHHRFLGAILRDLPTVPLTHALATRMIEAHEYALDGTDVPSWVWEYLATTATAAKKTAHDDENAHANNDNWLRLLVASEIAETLEHAAEAAFAAWAQTGVAGAADIAIWATVLTCVNATSASGYAGGGGHGPGEDGAWVATIAASNASLRDHLLLALRMSAAADGAGEWASAAN